MDDLAQSVLVQWRVNGVLHELDVLPGQSLMDVLRDALRLTGTHMGCMTGHCGACTVMIDGRIAKSCIAQAATLPRAEIRTIEGLMGPDGRLSPVQQAFWDEAGFQCGYCAPGMLFSAIELLSETPDPTDAEIDSALAGSLCRCTGYQSLRRAVRAAARALRETP
ncbi:(2Fe-2S)-binding protein [Thermaurantiacus tibetensis]|uniref:(2Fe-2S)-binding protein n=1 Tax=Thermaurantiacus tibetensis TaxID=2759035 RepID=UPI001A9C283B|nr:(2Fe-2S)-binding protein [Thermaurantiacus tibetensis]